MPEFRPIPDPSGSLQPPNRRPPTAVGAAAPVPEPHPSRPSHSRHRTRGRSGIEIAVRAALLVPISVLKLTRRIVRRAVR